MARKKRRSSRKTTIPLSIVAPTIVSVGRAIADPIYQMSQGMPPEEAMNHMIHRSTGYHPWSGTWDWNQLGMTYGPIILGAFIHKAMGYLGVNRVLARAKIPLIRI